MYRSFYFKYLEMVGLTDGAGRWRLAAVADREGSGARLKLEPTTPVAVEPDRAPITVATASRSVRPWASAMSRATAGGTWRTTFANSTPSRSMVSSPRAFSNGVSATSRAVSPGR